MKNLTSDLIKILIIIPVIIFISFSYYPKTKLLLYATIEDSVCLNKNDSVWLRKDICINLKIDTIFIDDIKKHKKTKSFFIYKNNVFNKTQLFNINELNQISQLLVNSFSINFGSGFDPPIVESNSSCMNFYQKTLLKQYWGIAKRYNQAKRLYFTEIVTLDKMNNNIKLNDITCVIK